MLSIVQSTDLDYSQQEQQQPCILNKRLYFHTKGDEIPLFPEGVWQVTQGLVQLSANYEDGEQVLFGWAAAGAWFGTQESATLDYQAIALSSVYLRWLRLDEIESSMRLSQILLPPLVKRMRQAELLLIINGRRHTVERLKGLLALLRDELGESLPNNQTRIGYKFTHQQLASAIGTTRVTVSRMMAQFQAKGYMTLDRHRHLILDDRYFDKIGN
ncbi:Crp/Fnr family transcriptional regulator [Chamaesiphon minutus]|uniref:cAMP-binding protein n=1 Tax=Chamaesiphon minutus (strain ATCC 27169 / PCC 6605) TaxID=1173020 RepID=K9UHZ2_CHAP6|nr:Crp/Fnr family transcriptional regulator [Chamaesiphon minutus]AFY93809.1 cAMP-binding protein [Chamaesiphon minutus PCC 6605]